MTTIQINSVDLHAVARSIRNYLKRVADTSSIALGDPGNPENIIKLRIAVYNAKQYLDSIKTTVTPEQIGPVMTELYGIVDWVTALITYEELRDVIFPAFLVYVDGIQGEILTAVFNGPEIQYPTLTADTSLGLATEITKITAKFS